MQTSPGQGKMLHLGWGKPSHKYKQSRELTKSSPGEKDLEVLLGERLDTSWKR